jgi:excisionase family DNA binding protein
MDFSEQSQFSDQLLTPPELAKALKVPVSWVYERTRRRGKHSLPHLKIGKYLRFDSAEVKNWLRGLRANELA